MSSGSRPVALARTVVRAPGRLLQIVFLLLIRGYRSFISPLTAPTCRYYPSCSSYAMTAVQRHGAVRGTWLAVRRVLRCHPWAAGGVDDVPPARPALVRLGHQH